MVASSAKISRPRWPDGEAGPSDFTLLRNASISARGDAAAGCLPASVVAGVRSFAMGPGSGSNPSYRCAFTGPAQWPESREEKWDENFDKLKRATDRCCGAHSVARWLVAF